MPTIAFHVFLSHFILTIIKRNFIVNNKVINWNRICFPAITGDSNLFRIKARVTVIKYNYTKALII